MTVLASAALRIALALLVVAMGLALIRVLRGPTAQDRIVAFDCLSLDGMLVMLTLGLSYRSSTYLETALMVALVGMTAMAKFLLRGEVIE
jgi:multicomponent K+:H+ antiporter subunit F